MRSGNMLGLHGPSRVRWGRLLIPAACLAVPGLLAAQNVRGVVTDSATNAPVPGVIIALLDSANKVTRQVMTDDKGAFVVIAPRPGTYRVWAMRIGFRPTTTDPVVLTPGYNVLDSLHLRGIALALDTVSVEAGTSCGGVGEKDQGLFAAWDQARAALTAVQLTAAARGVRATVLSYEQTRDSRTRRVQDQQSRVSTGFVTQPWGSASPTQLRREGWVVTDAEGFVTYHVPSLGSLLSDVFLQDHCFSIRRTRDQKLVGIRFEPTRERREFTEVTGTLWLEPKTAQLVRLEFGYANVPAVQENEAGGRLEFARMRDGGWAISSWHVQMPVVEQVMIRGNPVVRMAELRRVGGDLSLATRGADTLFMGEPVAVTGVVRDSASDAPLGGARVGLQGTTSSATTGANGKFQLSNVLPGAYVVEVRTAAYDSAGDVHQTPIVVTNEDDPLEIVLGPPRPKFGLLAGAVVMDSSGSGIPEAQVLIPDLSLSTYTDERGQFVLDSVAPGRHRLLVRKIGYGALDDSLTFVAGRRTERRIVLFRTPTLDTVSVVERSLIPSFDEHRAIGLGTFFTRADLEKQVGRRLSEVLGQVRGLRIVQGSANSAFLATRRRSNTRMGRVTNPATGESAFVGAEGWCYAAVYLDGSRLYEPQDDAHASSVPPFDLNTVSVDQIEAIEYYATQASVPMRYSRGNTTCGVIVIHTRRIPPRP